MKKVLIIGSRKTGNKNNPTQIADGLAKGGAYTSVIYWEDIVFKIARGAVQVTCNGEDILKDRPDLVIAVGWYKNGKNSIYRDVAYALALYLQDNEVTFWNSEMINQRSVSKLSCMMQLALAGIPIPETNFCIDIKKTISLLPMPFIAKAAGASRGKNNFLVRSEQELAQVYAADAHFLVQPFIQNDHDLRIICFNGNPTLVLKRSRKPGADTHLNNTSQGGDSSWLELTDVPAQVLTLSRKICTIMHREMAGVDFIADASSECGYSCLEVNAIPQLTSGVDNEKKLRAFSDAIQNI